MSIVSHPKEDPNNNCVILTVTCASRAPPQNVFILLGLSDRVQGLGFWVEGLGLRVLGLGFLGPK